MQVIKEQLVKSSDILADLNKLKPTNAELLELIQPTMYESSIKKIVLWYNIVNTEDSNDITITSVENKDWKTLNLKIDLSNMILLENKYRYCLILLWNEIDTVTLEQSDHSGFIIGEEIHNTDYVFCNRDFEIFKSIDKRID